MNQANFPPELEERGGNFFISGHRIKLVAIIENLVTGNDIDKIARTFPTISREKLEAAISYVRTHEQECLEYYRDLVKEADRLDANASIRVDMVKLKEALSASLRH